MATKTDNAAKEKCRVLTPEFVVYFPHVFKAAQVMGKGDPKFSITMGFKKTADLSVIKLAMKHAKIAAFGPDKANWPDDLESPVIDGDAPKYADKEGYKGHWIIKASSNQDNRPGVVDEDVQPITDSSAFYPGCYARAQVFARVWEYMGKQGVHFILDHVQKTRDGKAIGGKKAASEVFNPITNAGADDSDSDDGDSDDFT